MLSGSLKCVLNLEVLLHAVCLCCSRYSLLVALSYLSLCQITRVYVFDYGMYSADFTG